MIKHDSLTFHKSVIVFSDLDSSSFYLNASMSRPKTKQKKKNATTKVFLAHSLYRQHKGLFVYTSEFLSLACKSSSSIQLSTAINTTLVYVSLSLPLPLIDAMCASLLATRVLLGNNPLWIKNEIYEARKECVRRIVLKGFLIRCRELWRIEKLFKVLWASMHGWFLL